MKIEKFEDLEAWKVAHELALEVYRATMKDSFQDDVVLKQQMQETAIKIPAKIAHGFDVENAKGFYEMLFLAKGMCGEMNALLYLARDLNFMDNKAYLELSKKIHDAGYNINLLKKKVRDMGKK